MDVSHDGSIVATGSEDGTVFLSDPSSGTMIDALTFKSPVTGLSFNSTKTVLAICAETTDTVMYSLAEKKLTPLHTETVNGALSNETSPTIVRFSPQAPDRLLCANDTGRIWLWGPDKLAFSYSMQAHSDIVRAIEFSRDGTVFYSAGRDQVIRIWDSTSGKLIRELNGHTNQIYNLNLSHDGRRLVSSGGNSAFQNSELIIWNWQTGTALFVASPHTSAFRCAEFSPDDRELLTVGDDGTARLWTASRW